MTSQLNVDTIVDKAGSGGTNVKIANTSVTVAEGGSATTNTVQGLNKAWHLASNDSALTDSFNVSGGTDNGTGDYSYALSNSMNSANYSVAGVCAEDATRNQHTKARATGSYTVKHANLDNEAARDCANSSNVCGDLA
jgi:hypothetical protein